MSTGKSREPSTRKLDMSHLSFSDTRKSVARDLLLIQLWIMKMKLAFDISIFLAHLRFNRPEIRHELTECFIIKGTLLSTMYIRSVSLITFILLNNVFSLLQSMLFLLVATNTVSKAFKSATAVNYKQVTTFLRSLSFNIR